MNCALERDYFFTDPMLTYSHLIAPPKISCLWTSLALSLKTRAVNSQACAQKNFITLNHHTQLPKSLSISSWFRKQVLIYLSDTDLYFCCSTSRAATRCVIWILQKTQPLRVASLFDGSAATSNHCY